MPDASSMRGELSFRAFSPWPACLRRVCRFRMAPTPDPLLSHALGVNGMPGNQCARNKQAAVRGQARIAPRMSSASEKDAGDGQFRITRARGRVDGTVIAEILPRRL